MRVLQEELDDPSPQDCGRCSVCAGRRFDAPLDPALVEAAGRHLRSTPIELEVRKMAPDAGGVMRKIPADVLVEPGWALARFGDGGWWPALERGLESGEFSLDVVQALADIVRSAGGVDWVTSVPSVRLGDVVSRLGALIAKALSVPYVELVARADERPPQREMANAAQQAANVRGAFRIVATPPPGLGALLDDRRISGWTLAMVGGQLRRAGAERVLPLALATLQ
jgi:ATP-dependent DNA helicase RecQ